MSIELYVVVRLQYITVGIPFLLKNRLPWFFNRRRISSVSDKALPVVCHSLELAI
jgi:hypothetical protein